MTTRTLFPKEKEKEYSGRLAECFVLRKMNDGNEDFNITLELEDKPLEPVFRNLLRDDYVEIKKTSFIITQKGLTLAKVFNDCYKNFVSYYDVYCAVDLAEGMFAFEKSADYDSTEAAWKSYLQNERFEDLRISVAEYAGIAPSLFLFIVFLHEERFSNKMKVNGWQYDLMLGDFWTDMQKIYTSSLSIAELSYKSEDNQLISGEEVMADILLQGQEALKKIQPDYLSTPMGKNNHAHCWDNIF